MFIKLNKLVERINYTLENVVAGQVSDAFAKAQVYAVVELLNQMVSRIDYKPELLKQQIESNLEQIKIIADALTQAGRGLPEEVAQYLSQDPYQGLLSGAQWLKARDRSDVILCQAIDAAMDDKDKLGPEVYHQLEQGWIKFLTSSCARDLGLMKPPNIQRIYGRQEQ